MSGLRMPNIYKNSSQDLDLDYLPDEDDYENDGTDSGEPNSASVNQKHKLNLSQANSSSIVRLHGRNRSLAVQSEMNNYSSFDVRK